MKPLKALSPRPATSDDLAQVLKINKTVDPPWSESSFAGEIGKKHSQFWVVTDDETDSEVLAYAVFSHPADQAHLQTFAVHPKYRRQRIALGLLRKLTQFVMKLGVQSIVLEVKKSNEAAIKLYQSAGFIVIHTIPRFYSDGSDAYSMIYYVIRASKEEDIEQEAEYSEEVDNEPSPRNKKNLI